MHRKNRAYYFMIALLLSFGASTAAATVVDGVKFESKLHAQEVELYLKVVFKGKGGVSTGRLLAAVNRPH